MSSPISLFSGYSQKENRTTNYCLLLLKMLYEENPKFLAHVVSTLTTEEVGDSVGVKFFQQQRKIASIPDGLIRQEPFTIYVETKNFDWFYDQQLERHLKELHEEQKGLKVLIALGNFENTPKGRFSRVEKLCETKYRGEIAFAALSFQELIDTVKAIHLPKNISDVVADFEAYLDEEGLLPCEFWYWASVTRRASSKAAEAECLAANSILTFAISRPLRLPN